MKKLFSVIEYSSFFAVRHNPSGEEHPMGDGVDTLFTPTGKPMNPGAKGKDALTNLGGKPWKHTSLTWSIPDADALTTADVLMLVLQPHGRKKHGSKHYAEVRFGNLLFRLLSVYADGLARRIALRSARGWQAYCRQYRQVGNQIRGEPE